MNTYNIFQALAGRRCHEQYVLKAGAERIETFQCQTHLSSATGLQTRHTKKLKERKFAEEVARRIML